ncbi:hypothetical protein MAM1_0096c05087 [Mucor ambiguus]|uniref:Uncharacterized protein n=1 Tax=Mucor ambiguus TaxID=91626 RepID=A0A0C9M6S9_9FUNG|nr:hypothetical protein MAM1_0096c05087 [Mucor ambiguus]
MKLISQTLLLATIIPSGSMALDSSPGLWKRYYKRIENKVSKMHLSSFLSSDPDICSHNPTENLLLLVLSIQCYYVLGDFVTAGHNSVYGLLAVKDIFYEFSFTANKEHISDCTDLFDNLNADGLVVGGSAVGGNITVNGAVYLPPGSNTKPAPLTNTVEGTYSPQTDQDPHIHKHHHHLKPACFDIIGYHHCHHDLLFCEYENHQGEEMSEGFYGFDHEIQF